MKQCLIGVDFGKTNLRFAITEEQPELKYFTKLSYVRGSPDEMRRQIFEGIDAALEEGRVQYGDYPNALERIWGGLTNESSADIWLTSNIGYEFVLDGVKAHVGGGSHGRGDRDQGRETAFCASKDIPWVHSGSDGDG